MQQFNSNNDHNDSKKSPDDTTDIHSMTVISSAQTVPSSDLLFSPATFGLLIELAQEPFKKLLISDSNTHWEHKHKTIRVKFCIQLISIAAGIAAAIAYYPTGDEFANRMKWESQLMKTLASFAAAWGNFTVLATLGIKEIEVLIPYLTIGITRPKKLVAFYNRYDTSATIILSLLARITTVATVNTPIVLLILANTNSMLALLDYAEAILFLSAIRNFERYGKEFFDAVKYLFCCRWAQPKPSIDTIEIYFKGGWSYTVTHESTQTYSDDLFKHLHTTFQQRLRKNIEKLIHRALIKKDPSIRKSILDFIEDTIENRHGVDQQFTMKLIHLVMTQTSIHTSSTNSLEDFSKIVRHNDTASLMFVRPLSRSMAAAGSMMGCIGKYTGLVSSFPFIFSSIYEPVVRKVVISIAGNYDSVGGQITLCIQQLISFISNFLLVRLLLDVGKENGRNLGEFLIKLITGNIHLLSPTMKWRSLQAILYFSFAAMHTTLACSAVASTGGGILKFTANDQLDTNDTIFGDLPANWGWGNVSVALCWIGIGIFNLLTQKPVIDTFENFISFIEDQIRKLWCFNSQPEDQSIRQFYTDVKKFLEDLKDAKDARLIKSFVLHHFNSTYLNSKQRKEWVSWLFDIKEQDVDRLIAHCVQLSDKATKSSHTYTSGLFSQGMTPCLSNLLQQQLDGEKQTDHTDPQNYYFNMSPPAVSEKTSIWSFFCCCKRKIKQSEHIRLLDQSHRGNYSDDSSNQSFSSDEADRQPTEHANSWQFPSCTIM